jgi:Ras-related protein Rab-2A
VDLVCTEVKIGDVSFKAKIWDTAGTEKYRSMNRNFYKGTVGVMLVFDISKPISSKQIEEWEEEMGHIAKKPTVVVVGNKLDLEVNEETREVLQKYCNEHKYPYIQTCAKDGVNVTQAYSALLESVHQKHAIRKLLKKSSESFVLSIATNNDGCSGARFSQGACQC